MLIRNIKLNLGNLENLNKILVQITYNINKIKVQTSMANGHFGIIRYEARIVFSDQSR
jgi:hypothetical protein